MSHSSEYQPVACSVYDDLGLRTMRGTPCWPVLNLETGREVVETYMEDIYTEGDTEYMRVKGGRTVRLDRIGEVTDLDSASER